MTRGHLWALVLFAAVATPTWWHPPWPAEQALHSSLTLVALAGLALAHKRIGLPVRTWAWALIFLTLHTIAARWIYSFVPYDDWTDALLGVRLSDVFGWQRNHFDRLVHFAYGLCLTMMLRLKPLRSWEVVLATSALYELFEWGVAVVLARGDPYRTRMSFPRSLIRLVGTGWQVDATRSRTPVPRQPRAER